MVQKAGSIALVTVLLIASAYARGVANVLGTWEQDLSLTEGLCAEMLIDIGSTPAILEAAKVVGIKATISQNEKGELDFYQTLTDGRILTPGGDPTPLEYPKYMAMPGGAQFAVLSEIEEGVTVFVHKVGTPIYFEESFEVVEDGRMIRTFLAYKSGRKMVHVYNKVADREEL